MKKIIIVIMVAGLLLTGCAAVNSFLCKPTPAQVEAANVGRAVAQSILVAASAYSGGNPVIALVSANALPVFDKVLQGYCVVQAQWDSAVIAVQDADSQMQSLAWVEKAMRPAGAAKQVEYLKSVRW
jgi:hypothetical protein